MDKRKRRDLALAAALLVLAGLLWLIFRPSGQGGWAVVTVDGEEIGRYALNQERTVVIGEEDYNVLTIRDGTAAVTEANCGDHTCVRTGAISRTGETIICLPHHLVVQIVGGEPAEVDSVVG